MTLFPGPLVHQFHPPRLLQDYSQTIPSTPLLVPSTRPGSQPGIAWMIDMPLYPTWYTVVLGSGRFDPQSRVLSDRGKPCRANQQSPKDPRSIQTTFSPQCDQSWVVLCCFFAACYLKVCGFLSGLFRTAPAWPCARGESSLRACSHSHRECQGP